MVAIRTGATSVPQAMLSHPCQQHDATGHAAESATKKTRSEAERRTQTRKSRAGSDHPRALPGRVACRRLVATRATLLRAPSSRREASAARLGARASRSSQARQVRPSCRAHCHHPIHHHTRPCRATCRPNSPARILRSLPRVRCPAVIHLARLQTTIKTMAPVSTSNLESDHSRRRSL
jgi:hypothetical protein